MSIILRTADPDDFLLHLTDLNRNGFCSAIKSIRTRLKNPTKNKTEYLETLFNQGLNKTVSFLKEHLSLL